MKLTVIFTNCVQTGIDQWTNAKITRVIELTDEQNKLLNAPNEWILHEVVLEP
jgi:hypothetical protein